MVWWEDLVGLRGEGSSCGCSIALAVSSKAGRSPALLGEETRALEEAFSRDDAGDPTSSPGARASAASTGNTGGSVRLPA